MLAGNVGCRNASPAAAAAAATLRPPSSSQEKFLEDLEAKPRNCCANCCVLAASATCALLWASAALRVLDCASVQKNGPEKWDFL